MKKHQIVIIGAGTGGITVAAQLLNKNKNLDVAIVDPKETHDYQPAWTLVGADSYDMKKTKWPQKDLIPRNAEWIKEYVTKIDADNNKLELQNGESLGYDYLVVSPGLVNDLDGVEGLKEALQTDSVCSNYIDPEKTRRILKSFKGGNALFTQPTTPIKCGGAPQKIMYLAADYFRKNNLADKTHVTFATPGSVIFGVKVFADELLRVIDKYGINVKFHFQLYKIDGKAKKAYYRLAESKEVVDGKEINPSNKATEYIDNKTVALSYDMLHLAPPQKAPDFVAESKIAYKDGGNKGWANVDQHSLQNPDFSNVFALGDVAALPTAKTGAAIRKQAPVVVDNLLKLIAGKSADNYNYQGYSSCPLITGYGKMLLAEFGYDNKQMSDPLISTFVDTTKEKYSMWLLKKYALPFMYRHFMLKGKA